MDITKFVVQGRDQALLYGDYSTYHKSCTKRLLSCRKKLGIATRNRGKFRDHEKVTAEQIAQNHEYVHLLLLTSERAWAQTMKMKSGHDNDSKGITGRLRSHIASRLIKATRAADELVEALSQTDVSGASQNDLLEANAYAYLIRGTASFEKQSWESSLQNYAAARVIYSALASATTGDLYKDLLTETIDPSIRYAAYQLKTPRTVPIPIIARKAFPQSDANLVKQINDIDPTILKSDEAKAKDGIASAEGAPKTLTWRSREVNIEDAQIAMAWGAVLAAKERLAANLAQPKGRGPYELAGAYDEILMLSQDAVDATKQAIDEMRAEGVEQGDARMQSLQITRTAVNFETISWRIGRSRVLTGEHDGALDQYSSPRRGKKAAQDAEKDIPTVKKLAKLKEKVALYDGILQNIESITELPGVANDQGLAEQIAAYVKYFEALKALAIARSHATSGNAAEALALINHADGLVDESQSNVPASEGSNKTPLSLSVSAQDVEYLQNLLNGELQRHRAIVHIDTLRKNHELSVADAVKRPLIETQDQYPTGGVNLDHIVEFPPKLAAIPVKPIFLDVAWNYIEYPGKAPQQESAPAKAKDEVPKTAESPAPQQAKRGWFGFGRS
ncbi:signal recognition particle subunit srp68 [Fusarium irregulare]|uniref:Signal recognition particle subunit SRP68 n=1 Tax=Fusarium irregulare TaxID=2494466 RepID=A0A9W8PY44_9HYPO|nr:signal recognition particle subunit srp68 [Fusarium irregulare]KAJ4020628.1 signal recognition particle subunit srp68 [Fusarium irregulare]